MPSDTILTNDFETGMQIVISIQEAIALRNKYSQTAFRMDIYVECLTALINKHQAPIAEKLKGNSNSSLE